MTSVFYIYLVEWTYQICGIPWFICVAENMGQARRLHPQGYTYSDKKKRWLISGRPVMFPKWALSLVELRVTKLGNSLKYNKSMIIKHGENYDYER